jgi:biotin operon repressor
MGLALGITEAAVNHRIERIKDKLRTLNQTTI